MSGFKVVAVSGNLATPSRTLVLVNQILEAVTEYVNADVQIITLADIGADFGQKFYRTQLPPHAENALRAIETADLLIVATPVYRASFTGLFKHLFDFVDQNALVEVPVILAATGGSDRHSLVIEHQLRPLFSFFRAHTVPSGIYATESDFNGYELHNPKLIERINGAARQAASLLNPANARTEKLRAIA